VYQVCIINQVVSHLTPIVRHNKALTMSDKKSLYPRENGALTRGLVTLSDRLAG
jgi:hypothetical protein